MSWINPSNPQDPPPPYHPGMHPPPPVAMPMQYPPNLTGNAFSIPTHTHGAVLCPPGGLPSGLHPPTSPGFVLDIKGSKMKKGTDVISYPDKNQTNQKFRAVQLGTGFQLCTMEQGKKGKSLVLDYSVKHSQLVIYEAHHKPNQLFVSQETSPGSQVYRIKSLQNNRCLRANGIGSQVTLALENSSDMLQQWKLVPTY